MTTQSRPPAGYRITSPEGWVIEASDETAHQRVLHALTHLRAILANPNAPAGIPAPPQGSAALQAWWEWMMTNTAGDLAVGGQPMDLPTARSH